VALIDFLGRFDPVSQALLATLFTWAVTALGAALVFLTPGWNRTLMDSTVGFGAGVMVAASFWSLLEPAIDLAGRLGQMAWLTAAVGFLAGGLFMQSGERLLRRTAERRSALLVLAITLHNIPEGLAVGVAFGATAAGVPSASLGAAVALAIGIGLQNFPEGAAVSLPLRREGMGLRRSFLFGQGSALVEPLAGVIGAAFVLAMRGILPFALSFAAGAMIYVVVRELVPQSQSRRRSSGVVSLATMLGFTVMMVLDVSLG
jgi:ZIP family zinc transporter